MIMDPLKQKSIKQWKEIYQKVGSLQAVQDPKYMILDNTDLTILLKVSSRTLKKWRDNNLIAYSQISNKIFYRLNDVIKFLEDNYNPSV